MPMPTTCSRHQLDQTACLNTGTGERLQLAEPHESAAVASQADHRAPRTRQPGPQNGGQFPVPVLYFSDETFLLVDRVEERHLLFRCLLADREVVATGTRHPWNPRISGPGDDDLSIRVYVFFGYDSPDRSTQMTVQHLAACISSFADNSHRVRRRIGEAEQQLVQRVHDGFFQVTR